MTDYNLGTARGTIDIGYKGAGPKQAREDMDRLKTSSMSTDAALGKVARGAGVSGLVLAGGLTLAAKAAGGFEKRLSGIQAVSGATAADMDKISQKALQLGKDTAFSADESALAIEELIKAGLSVEDVLNGAADATVNLAAAGEIDMPQAATIASNAMNQFGLAAKNLPDVADNIAGAANASAIDVGEFGQSLSQVGAVANLAGLSFEDTAVAIAEMGNAGIKGSDAGTSLKSMLSRLQPVTKQAADEYKRLGIITEDGTNRFYDQEGRLKGLSDVQAILGDSLKGMTAQQKQATLQTLFGADAIRAAAILADNGAEGYDKMSESMGKVTAAEVAATRMDNLSGSIEELTGSAETFAIALGTILIPVIRKVVDSLTGVLDAFLNLSDGQKKAVVTAAALASGLLLGVATLIKIAQFARAARAAFVTLRLAMLATSLASTVLAGSTTLLAGLTGVKTGATFATKALNLLGRGIRLVGLAFRALGVALFANPIGLIILAIIALVAAFVLLYKKNEAFRNLVNKVWSAIKSAIGSVVDWLVGTAFPAIAGAFKAVVGAAKAVGSGVASAFGAIAGFIGSVFGAISSTISGAMNFIQGVITGALNIIKGIWNAVWGTFGPALQGIFNVIVEIVKLGLVLLAAPFILAFVALRLLWNLFWTGLKAIVSTVWSALVTIVTTAINLLKSVITTVFNAIKTVVTTVWNAIRSATSSVWNAIKSAVSGPLNGIRSVVASVLGAIRGVISSVWGSVRSITSSTWNALKGIVSNAIGNVVGVVRGIKDRVMGPLRSAGTWLASAGRSIIDGLVNGIKNATGLIASAIAGVKDKVVNGLKGALKINSPSKVVIPIGSAVPEGLAVGIDEGTKHVIRSLADLSGTVPANLNPNVEASVRMSAIGPPELAPPREDPRAARGGAQSSLRMVSGTMKTDRGFDVLVKGIVEEVQESDSDFDQTLARMGTTNLEDLG